MRAVNGLIADALTGHAHGITEGVTAMRGRLNPEQSVVLTRAMGQGFRSDILPSPRDVAAQEPSMVPGLKTTGKILSGPRKFAEVAKVSSVMEGVRHIMGEADMSTEQQNAAIRRFLKLADDQYGGKTAPPTLPAVIQAPLHVLSPLLGYETAQARMAGRALTGDTAALRGMVGNAAIYLATNGLLTYAFTGQAPTGADFLNFRTGKKDNDGTEVRGHLPGIMSNFVDDVVSASQGRYGDILSRKTNPQVTAIAQSLTGRDYQGNPLSAEGRATNILQNLVPLMPTQAHFWKSPEEREYEGQGFPWEAQALGFRGASKKIERSEFMNAAEDIHQAAHSPLDAAQQDAQRQRFDWMDRLEGDGLGKNLDAVVGEMGQAGYKENQIVELVKASQAPGGVLRMSQVLEPQQLAQIWDKASKGEQAQMLPVLAQRLQNRKADEESPQTTQGWMDLVNKW
jgi:hypothetical protein